MGSLEKIFEIPLVDEQSFDAQSFDLVIEFDDSQYAVTQEEASLPCGCALEVTESLAGFTFCDSHRKIL